MTSEARRICNSLAAAGESGASGQQVANRTLQVWVDIDASLSPIIGSLGVTALFDRSLFLSRSAHPGLADLPQPSDRQAFGALHAGLARLPGADAAAAASEMVQTFCDLLGSLIGTSLTERLLSSVRDFPSSGTAAQDTPS